MHSTKVGSRYAKALLGLSMEQGALETVYADMKLIDAVCKENKSFVLMLNSPIIKTDKKTAVLMATFDGRVSKLTMDFIVLVARKKREANIDLIAAAFINQYKEKKKILTAVITTAFGLDQELREKVLQVVKDTMKSEVELVEKVNKELIGGFIIRVGDRQDDTSISRKIKNLTRVFNENPYIKEF